MCWRKIGREGTMEENYQRDGAGSREVEWLKQRCFCCKGTRLISIRFTCPTFGWWCLALNVSFFFFAFPFYILFTRVKWNWGFLFLHWSGSCWAADVLLVYAQRPCILSCQWQRSVGKDACYRSADGNACSGCMPCPRFCPFSGGDDCRLTMQPCQRSFDRDGKWTYRHRHLQRLRPLEKYTLHLLHRPYLPNHRRRLQRMMIFSAVPKSMWCFQREARMMMSVVLWWVMRPSAE